MISNEYRIAFSETLDILNHTRKEDVEKIPNTFLDFLKSNSSNNYESKLDFNKSIKDMELSNKTIGVLSIINKKYWCDDKQRKDFEEKLEQNEIIYQNQLKEKYSNQNLFEKKKVERAQNVDLIVLEDKKWYKKIFEKILSIFRKK